MSFLLLETENSPAAHRIWEMDSDWWLPPLWRSEFLNVLVQSMRARLIGEGQAKDLWKSAADLFVPHEIQPSEYGILEFALEREISAYDAHFVTLAAQLQVSLVTADQQLARKCPDIAVSIESFTAV